MRNGIRTVSNLSVGFTHMMDDLKSWRSVGFKFVGLYATLLVLLATTVGLAADGPSPYQMQSDVEQGWIHLFDGQTLYGWEAGSKADWTVVDKTIKVTSGEQGLLCTTCEFGDYELKVSFKATSKTNSGIFLRTPLVPKDPKSDCYELNIAAPAISPFPTNSFVQRQKSEVTPPADEAWHQYHVVAAGGHFVVKLDGQQVLDYTDPQPLRRGRIGLQYNTGECQFRDISLKPLGLKPLLNGKDLTGWHVSKESKHKSDVTVTKEGALNIKNGPGQVESDDKFADFTLQVEVFSNGKALNSGIFFRSIPGEWWNGYECQIQNGFKDDDRTKPADCGTGGFYRRQSARAVMANDFEWFALTLCTNGPHMAAWVNGHQVSDWTDTRAPHDNPRNGLRTAAGTFIIQGHDATTDISFRKFRAAELPGK